MLWDGFHGNMATIIWREAINWSQHLNVYFAIKTWSMLPGNYQNSENQIPVNNTNYTVIICN